MIRSDVTSEVSHDPANAILQGLLYQILNGVLLKKYDYLLLANIKVKFGHTRDDSIREPLINQINESSR